MLKYFTMPPRLGRCGPGVCALTLAAAAAVVVSSPASAQTTQASVSVADAALAVPPASAEEPAPAVQQPEPAAAAQLVPSADVDAPRVDLPRSPADDLAVAHGIDIPLNARVMSQVRLFTGRLKGYLEGGLARGA